MYDQVVEWVKSVLGDTYQYSRGMWVENVALNEVFICAILLDGGAAPDVQDRRQRFRLVLLGPRNGRQHAGQVMADAELLMQATLNAPPPCGAAQARATGEPVGPAYTTENRAWMQVNLQVLF